MGGGSILQFHGGSLSNLLSYNYPEQEWLPWKFIQRQKNYWTLENQKEFIRWAEKELKITTMNDWYKITTRV